MNIFQKALNRTNTDRPPVWFMRQAGRYHSHYQGLRQTYSFMDLCKKPELATEVTMGPINDFDFDAAILFSDLLFPLEVMGMGLEYNPAPALGWHLKSISDLQKLKEGESLAAELGFQGSALRSIRKALPSSKGLLGFVGSPWTLFCYAVEGSHKGSLEEPKKGLLDGRFLGFCEKLLPLLARNMADQALAGPDAVAIFDTCAGDLTPELYQKFVVPALEKLIGLCRSFASNIALVYYSKNTEPSHWKCIAHLPIACMGVDWHHELDVVLNNWSDKFAIQGNIDPSWLFLPEAELLSRVKTVFEKVKDLPIEKRQGWVCGLGHGVLPKTPESNVKAFLRLQKEIFG